MSILQKVFDKLRGQQAEQEQAKATTMANVMDAIVRQVTGQRETEEDAALLERAVTEGLITIDRLQFLHDQGVILREHFRVSEQPFVDGDAARQNFARIRDEMNERLKEAAAKIHEADATNSATREARQAAQRMAYEVPELAIALARSVKLSWTPKYQSYEHTRLAESLADSNTEEVLPGAR